MFKYNLFLFKDLPSAWLCGIRVNELNDKKCLVSVKHNWFNSNPFRSLYWAVQGMASELTTGMLIIKEKDNFDFNISMLVVSNSSKFLKKAKGKIIFECNDVKIIKDSFQNLTINSPTTVIKLSSKGYDSIGDIVSEFNYEWSIKRKF
mgnify:FL=1